MKLRESFSVGSIESGSSQFQAVILDATLLSKESAFRMIHFPFFCFCSAFLLSLPQMQTLRQCQDLLANYSKASATNLHFYRSTNNIFNLDPLISPRCSVVVRL